jgi:hypothetical protein
LTGPLRYALQVAVQEIETMGLDLFAEILSSRVSDHRKCSAIAPGEQARSSHGGRVGSLVVVVDGDRNSISPVLFVA